MRIAEIFYSVQGEGCLVGMPSIFVRASGCNLRCVWCDTPYTSWRPQGEEWNVKQILREISNYPSRHVVVTGGEPLLAPDLEELATELKQSGKHITVETAATIYKPIACNLVSMSPKLANSTPWQRANGQFAAMHEARRLDISVIQQFINGYDYQLKFVVEQRTDFDEIRAIVGALDRVDPARVLIMAQGTTRSQLRAKTPWIVELCKTFGYRFTPRLHIELYGNRRAT